jgi:hypothetical protein
MFLKLSEFYESVQVEPMIEVFSNLTKICLTVSHTLFQIGKLMNNILSSASVQYHV